VILPVSFLLVGVKLVMHVTASVADIRKEPNSRSERLSQLVYGEKVQIISQGSEYSLIRCPDGLEGYIKNTLTAEKDPPKYKIVRHYSARGMTFSFGSYLNDADLERYRVRKTYVVPIQKKYEPAILAPKFLGIPYLWGGTSDFGFDCSGFTQRLFRFSGIEIPRNSDQQKESSKPIRNLSEAKKGDLLFFEGHVALYLGQNKIIHANGHFSSVSYTDLSDGSNYSAYLLNNIVKVGRFD